MNYSSIWHQCVYSSISIISWIWRRCQLVSQKIRMKTPTRWSFNKFVCYLTFSTCISDYKSIKSSIFPVFVVFWDAESRSRIYRRLLPERVGREFPAKTIRLIWLWTCVADMTITKKTEKNIEMFFKAPYHDLIVETA